MKRVITTFLIWAAMASGAVAQVPPSCTPVLTVLKNNCSLQNIYKCNGPDGLGIYSEIYDDGLQGIAEYYTSDLAFIKAVEIGDISHFSVIAIINSGKEFSLKLLLETGTATVRRKILIQAGFIPQKPIGINADFRLGNETIEIDGTRLRAGSSIADIVIGRPFGAIHEESEIFYSEQDGILFEGKHTIRMGDQGEVEEYDEHPIKLIRQGQKGFMSTTPEHQCGPVLSGLEMIHLENNG